MILERSRISLHPFQAREKDTTTQARNLRLPDLNLKNLQLIITLKLILHARQFFVSSVVLSVLLVTQLFAESHILIFKIFHL